MAKTDKLLTKDALVSMQVIDSKGRLVGKVKDVAFVVGEMGISLSVENETGEIQCIPWQQILAATDFILLKPDFKSGTPGQCEKKEGDAIVMPVVELAEQPKQPEKEAPKKQSEKPLCPTCNQPLTWIPQYSRWYCYNDKKYVNPKESAKKNDWEEVFQDQKEPASKKQSSPPLCPTCNKPLTWIPQYSRWYCYNDKKYV